MTTFYLVVLVPVILSLAVNEVCDLAPWLARRVVPVAARLWAARDAERAGVLEEEWAAVVADCPGKLTKLAVALRFLAGAAWRYEQAQIVRRYRVTRWRLILRFRLRGQRFTRLFTAAFAVASSAVLGILMFTVDWRNPSSISSAFVTAFTIFATTATLLLAVRSCRGSYRAAAAAERSAAAAERARRAEVQRQPPPRDRA